MCVFLFDGDDLVISGDLVVVVLPPKYADFFCLLICADAGGIVDRGAVVGCASWFANQPLSAGKQIARYLAILAKQGIEPVLATQKTDNWRLQHEVYQNITEHIRAMARNRIQSGKQDDKVTSTKSLHTLLDWYRVNFEALVAMTTGQANTGYAMLRTCMNDTENDTLLAISNVLATRIEQRMGNQRIPILPSVNVFAAPLARAIEIRRNVAYAIYAKSSEWSGLAALYRRELAMLASTSDFTSIAILHNALGVLLRRQGDMHGALAQLQTAAPLAIFSGDIILIQNVAFNLANICSEIHRNQPDFMAPEAFIDLLKYDVHLRDTMALGRDSAQTELLLAYLLYEAGDTVQAHIYLAMAGKIIADTDIATDKALYARIAGKLAAQVGDPATARLQLDLAAQFYRSVGYSAAADLVADEIANL